MCLAAWECWRNTGRNRDEINVKMKLCAVCSVQVHNVLTSRRVIEHLESMHYETANTTQTVETGNVKEK